MTFLTLKVERMNGRKAGQLILTATIPEGSRFDWHEIELVDERRSGFDHAELRDRLA